MNFAYNADGLDTTISRYANLAATQLVATSTYGYDADGEITSLSHDKGGTNLNAYTWTYDHAGRVTADSSSDGTDSYTYDSSGQETAVTHSYATNESYSYDANGFEHRLRPPARTTKSPPTARTITRMTTKAT